MDAYHAIHGHDIASFGSPLTHRVLTVSAADADMLSQSSTSSEAATLTQYVSTGLETLDSVLSGSSAAPACCAVAPASEVEAGGDAKRTEPGRLERTDAEQQQQSTARPSQSGGLRRGELTEVWGPPGVGKTAFGMQLVASALCDGGSAVWVDCFHSLPIDRLRAVVDFAAQSGQTTGKGIDDGLQHYVCPSLPHFIAMLCLPETAPLPSRMPQDASVLVIDSLSALINYALPRTPDQKSEPLMANGKKGPAPHEKRSQVLQYIVAALEWLAETHNLAVVLLTQCATRIQADRGGAGLVPAISAVVWDHGIATRLVLFRDWAWQSNDKKLISGRFVGVQKQHGTSNAHATIDSVVAFEITETCLAEQHYSTIPPPLLTSMYKRKHDDAELENDENYGWDDDDDGAMPPMPPQWQGSEDLLLGNSYEGEEVEEGDEEGPASQTEAEEEQDEDQDLNAARVNAVFASSETPTKVSGLERMQGPRRGRSPQSVADSEDDSDL